MPSARSARCSARSPARIRPRPRSSSSTTARATGPRRSPRASERASSPARGLGFAGGARNQGWEAASGDTVVFLDSDAIPDPGWGAGLARALDEFPDAIIGCARTFSASSSWGWVAYLQFETPYLPLGEPHERRFVSSFCIAVPRGAPLRWDESYGGEDGVFSADAIAAGIHLVFDPRFHAVHDHGREGFEDLRGQQRRLAYGLARLGPVQREGTHKRVLARPADPLLRAPAATCHLPQDSRDPGAPIAVHPRAPTARRRGVDARSERAALHAPTATRAGTTRRRFSLSMGFR